MGSRTIFFCDWCGGDVESEGQLINIRDDRNRPKITEIIFGGATFRVFLNGVELNDEYKTSIVKVCSVCNQMLLAAVASFDVNETQFDKSMAEIPEKESEGAK